MAPAKAEQKEIELSDSEDDNSLEENDDDYLSDTPLDIEPNYPELNDSMDSVIIITTLPKVPQAKIEKLSKVILKLVSRVGNLATFPENDYTGMIMPFDSKTSNLTCGFAFVEYETAEEALQAKKVLEGYKFDKNHTLQVFAYDDARGLEGMSDEDFVQPEPAPFVPRSSTSSWLLDDAQRDQFVIREGRETVVCWNDGVKLAPVVDYDGHREKAAGVVWCEYYVQFSPKGSYLATLVPNKGVIVWGGEKYEKLGRFPASGVQFVVFSPQEDYILTCNNKKDDNSAVKIFHIASGKLLRAFGMFPKGFEDSDKSAPPPFHWSHDDKYLARMGKDLISIYETPSMKLLEQKSLLTNGILEFQWSPKANIIAYWAPEIKNAPAHVDIISIPSREKLRQKNLFNVTSCSMVWQDEGEFLAVKVTRHTKSKKTLYNNLELFRMNDKGLPVEMLEIKDAVMALAWESRGSRFAMIHAESPTSPKVNVSFYDMMKKQDLPKKKDKSVKNSAPSIIAELHMIETLEGKQCNSLFWSPAGGVILLAALGDVAASGSLEFYDLSDKTTVIKEHYRANAVTWDPSGRTVATMVSQPIEGGHFKYAMDNGYTLWSFQGKQLSQKNYEHFYQFQWRPRQNILSKQKIQTEVKKNLKKYERQFDAADKERNWRKKLHETKAKRILRSKFRSRLGRLTEFYDSQKEERMRLTGGYDSDDESQYVFKDVTREIILEENTRSVPI